MSMLIGIAGPAGSGKTTAAQRLVQEHGFVRVRFAEAIKAMARGLFVASGYDDGIIERMVDGDLKNTPMPELMGASPRVIMQTIGGEWGRETIHSDLWVRIATTKAGELLGEGIPVVIDDVRHANEVQAIQGYAGLVWKIAGRSDSGVPAHTSERELLTGIDALLYNTGSLEELHDQVDWLLEHYERTTV